MEFPAKVFMSVCTALMFIICLLMGAKFREYQTQWIMGALLFLIITCILMWAIVLGEYTAYNHSLEDIAIALSKLDQQGREMLGYAFPTMRFVMERGLVKQKFENTGVDVDLFIEFMSTSNEVYISPERDWSTSDKPHWAWEQIVDYLISNDDIIPDSAMGPKSHLWKSRSVYQRYCAYWLKGRRLADLNESEAV